MDARHVAFVTATAALFSAVAAACSATDTSLAPPEGGGDAGARADARPDAVFPPPVVCATLDNAFPVSTRILFLFDRSGSMGNVSDGADPARKWTPFRSALKSFVSDAASVSLEASLQFFPLGTAPPFANPSNPTTMERQAAIDVVCNFDYAKPVFGLAPLPSSAFAAVLDAATPSGGSPLLPAYVGTVAYAKTVSAAAPEKKTVIVLMTDGEPGMLLADGETRGPGCENNDIPHISDAAKAAFEGTPSIATYVIGAGNEVTPMNPVARAGGTDGAFIVNLAKPAETAGLVTDVLARIRRDVESCDYPIPAPPEGNTVDPNGLKVTLTSEGADVAVARSIDCSNPDGWNYEPLKDPKYVRLCSNACKKVDGSAVKLKLSVACAAR